MKITVTQEVNDEDFNNMTDEEIIDYFWDDLAELVDNAEWNIIREDNEKHQAKANVRKSNTD